MRTSEPKMARWISPDGQTFVLWRAGRRRHAARQAQPKSKLKDPAKFKVMGQPLPRVDIPAKVTGGGAYVQDMRLPGMVHARVVRPSSYGAQLTECDTSTVEKLPGVVKVVRDGNFLAVVAKKEFQAIKAMTALAAAAKWKKRRQACRSRRICPRVLTSLPSQDKVIFQHSDPSAVGGKTLEATYTRPYQAHGSIGLSCAVAQSVDGVGDRLDPYPGRLSRPPGYRRDVARAAGQGSLHPCRRLRLLWP